jgi:hypothetical protein
VLAAIAGKQLPRLESIGGCLTRDRVIGDPHGVEPERLDPPRSVSDLLPADEQEQPETGGADRARDGAGIGPVHEDFRDEHPSGSRTAFLGSNGLTVCRHTWATNYRKRDCGDVYDVTYEGGWSDSR